MQRSSRARLRSTAEDIELALDAAHQAAPAWGKTAPAIRAVILNKIADRMEENLQQLAVAESWDNGKPVFALNQGEVCTCPSRVLIEKPIYDEFLSAAAIRTKAVKQGDPLDTETMVSPAAATSSRRSLRAATTCGSSRRRSSGQWCR